MAFGIASKRGDKKGVIFAVNAANMTFIYQIPAILNHPEKSENPIKTFIFNWLQIWHITCIVIKKDEFKIEELTNKTGKE